MKSVDGDEVILSLDDVPRVVRMDDLCLADRVRVRDVKNDRSPFFRAIRPWQSADGRHTVDAKAVVVDEDAVVIVKEGDKVVRVPLDKLSEEDQRFAASLLAADLEVKAGKLLDSGQTEFVAQVVGVTDGDTIRVLIDRSEVKVRLEGIDAPEMGQPFGTDAKRELSDLVFGQEVTIRKTGVDRYRRMLAVVEFRGRSANQVMVRRGYAWHYTKYSDDRELAAAEAAAKAFKHGLWEDDVEPVAPWDWRDRRSAKPVAASAAAGT